MKIKIIIQTMKPKKYQRNKSTKIVNIMEIKNTDKMTIHEFLAELNYSSRPSFNPKFYRNFSNSPWKVSANLSISTLGRQIQSKNVIESYRRNVWFVNNFGYVLLFGSNFYGF